MISLQEVVKDKVNDILDDPQRHLEYLQFGEESIYRLFGTLKDNDLIKEV